MGISILISKVIGMNAQDVTENSSPTTVDGWTSIKMLMLISAVETEYGIKLSLDEMKKLYDVKSFLDMLQQRGIEDADL